MSGIPFGLEIDLLRLERLSGGRGRSLNLNLVGTYP